MSRLLAHDRRALGSDQSVLGTTGGPFPMRYLTVGGVPAFELSPVCGTCGLVLQRRPEAPSLQADVAAVHAQLAGGLTDLTSPVVDTFAAQLPASEYLVVLMDVAPELVHPGSERDYFIHDRYEVWPPEPEGTPDEQPNTAYYRIGDAPAGPQADLFQFAVPMLPLANTDPTVVDRYRQPGVAPTAVAYGILDVTAHWDSPHHHWGLFHYLLDGHHKALAAAQDGRPLRLLSYISVTESLAHSAEIDRLPEILATTTPGR